MIISLLFILLYALIACLLLELVFYIIGLFFFPPPGQFPARIRQFIYAIVGVLFVIQIVQLFVGGPQWLYFPRR